MLGLDCSGKTTMLYQIKDLSQVMMTVPKIGFCLEILEFENYKIHCFDINGNENDSYKNYYWVPIYEKADAIIYVIDSNDIDRLYDANLEIDKLLLDQLLKNKPLLILANKQDLNGAINPDTLSEQFNLKNKITDRKWSLQGISSKCNIGLKESFEWINNCLSENK